MRNPSINVTHLAGHTMGMVENICNRRIPLIETVLYSLKQTINLLASALKISRGKIIKFGPNNGISVLYTLF